MSSSPAEECRSPVGLDCCSCCLDLANRSVLEEGAGGENNNPGSPTVSSFRQLREQLVQQNLNTDKLSSIMRQDSLEPVVRDPCYLFNQGICNRNIDQTLLSILLLFHSPGSILNARGSSSPLASPSQSRGLTVRDLPAASPNADRVHPFSQPPGSASGASVVAIDNKIEQAMVSCSAAPSPPTFPHHPAGAVPGGGLPAPGSCEKSSDVCCAGGGGGPERANQGTVGEKLPAGA
ncbi:TSC22 domain family protein 3 isoform X2 [Sylvia atricapilla]|uniref:TSC22 domain family protein 3 isoform X2 n=1 Tax=Sylvia atricapilla TaxID=48155 RepID=UPI003396BA29